MAFFKTMKTDEERMVDSLLSTKGAVYALYEMAHNIDVTVGVENEQANLLNMVRADLVAFMLYLSAADGTIEQPEVDTINAFLDTSFTKDDCKKLVKEAGIYSEHFESSLPNSLMLLQTMAVASSAAGKLKDALIAIYLQLGSILIAADGEAHPNETRDLKIYLNMLQSKL